MSALVVFRRIVPEPARRAIGGALERALAIAALPVLAGVAVVARLRRPRPTGRPRVVWGPEPILSYAHWSRALRKAGYESETVMELSLIHI